MKSLSYLFGAMMFFTSSIYADTFTFTWTPPTARENGITLSPEEIKGYAVMVNGVERDTLLTGGENNLIIVIPSGVACVSLATVDTDGRRSDWTFPLCGEALSPPEKPSNIITESAAVLINN